ncbi:MAG: LamG domain-containing protein [Planctomycetota bacterium]|nr:MAG: LamG domain-containing protein [Planctomycetota bacterium]
MQRPVQRNRYPRRRAAVGARRPLLLAVLSAASLLAARPGAAAPLTSGLLAFWEANTSAVDATGNGHDGTLRNGASFAPSQAGQAFALDGFNDYVDIGAPSDLVLSGTSFTLSAWVYLTASADGSTDEGIVSRYPASGGGWILGRWRSGNLWFGLDSNGTWSPERGAQGGVLPLNTWTHVTAVYEHTTGTIRVYRNGALDGTNTGAPITVYPAASRVSIGAWYNYDGTAGAQAVPGLVDDVGIWNRALSPSEIAQLAATTGFPVPEPRALLLALGALALALGRSRHRRS